MRASRGDREQAIEMLKTAFVQERLTKDELDARVGQALAAHTYADLDAVTADIPIAPKLPPLPQTVPGPLSPHVPRHPEVRRAIKSSATALGVVIVATGIATGVAINPVAGVFVAMVFAMVAAIPAGFAALVIRGALLIEEQSRRRKQSRGSTPPRPGPGTSDQTSWRPSPAPPRRPGGDTALASALWTALPRPRRSTTGWMSSAVCGSPATRRLVPR